MAHTWSRKLLILDWVLIKKKKKKEKTKQKTRAYLKLAILLAFALSVVAFPSQVLKQNFKIIFTHLYTEKDSIVFCIMKNRLFLDQIR